MDALLPSQIQVGPAEFANAHPCLGCDANPRGPDGLALRSGWALSERAAISVGGRFWRGDPLELDGLTRTEAILWGAEDGVRLPVQRLGPGVDLAFEASSAWGLLTVGAAPLPVDPYLRVGLAAQRLRNAEVAWDPLRLVPLAPAWGLGPCWATGVELQFARGAVRVGIEGQLWVAEEPDFTAGVGYPERALYMARWAEAAWVVRF